jgi:hypothetical protein
VAKTSAELDVRSSEDAYDYDYILWLMQNGVRTEASAAFATIDAVEAVSSAAEEGIELEDPVERTARA